MNKRTEGDWHTGSGNGEGSIFADEGRMKLVDGVTTLFPICTMVTGFNEAEDKANAELIQKCTLLPEIIRESKTLLWFCETVYHHQRAGKATILRATQNLEALIAKYKSGQIIKTRPPTN